MQFMICRTVAAIVLIGISSFGIAGAQAEDMTTHETVLDVRFGPLSVGEAKFEISFNETSYELGASGKTVGIVDMVASGSGLAKSAGRIEDYRVIVDEASAEFREESDISTLTMNFDEGAVTEVVAEPDERKSKDGPKWVQIAEEQLRAVLDPASTIVIPVAWEEANNPRAVCNQHIPVYDGDTRFDIKLNYKSTKPVRTTGYKGWAYVCQLRYVPVSGHKKGERNIEYMRDNEDIEIWLAPMNKTNLYTPIRVEVPTWIGTFSAIPRYFGVVN